MKRITKLITTIVVSTFLSASLSIVQADESKFPPLMFKKGEVQFNIDTPILNGSDTESIANTMDSSSKRHMIMQFQTLPTDAVKQELAENGITLLAYMPKNAYWVTIEKKGILYAEANLVNSDGESGHILWSPPSHYKLSKAVEDRNFPTISIDGDKVKLNIAFYQDVSQTEAETVLSQDVQVTNVKWKDKHLAEISINQNMIDTLANIDAVERIENFSQDGTDNVTSAQRIHVDTIKGNPLNLDGTGVVVGVWDSGRAGQHQDLAGRVTFTTNQAVHNHASHVIGTIIGNGAGNPAAEGMAPLATVRNGSFLDTYLPEVAAEAQNGTIHLSNWSFGTITGWSLGVLENNSGLFGNYTNQTVSVDNIVADHGLLIFKSAGNDRNDCNPLDDTDCDGDPDGYDTMSHKGTAKNIVTMGATDDTDAMTAFSGWGPTDDHRVKPDLCANGHGLVSTQPNNAYVSFNGTSMSTPSAAGAATLLYQHYNTVYGAFPNDAAIMKGVMIHSANEFGTIGPDAQCGWGLIDAAKATVIITDQHIKSESIAQADTEKTMQISVPAAATVMKVSLVWTDPAGTAAGAVNLVNNLDLRLVDPSGTTHLPWVLNSVDGYRTAVLGDNNHDNVEQVTVNNPVAGNWTVKVINDGIPTGPQNYVLVFDYDEASAVNLPSITSPLSGSTLTGSTETFTWNAGATPVTEWWLYVGSSVGANDYHDSSSLGALVTQNVTGLPTDGSTVYVRLWYLEGGDWKSVDTTYTAANNATLPSISTPTNGSTLTGASQTFSWSANGTSVTEWWLYVGSSVAANDYHDSSSLGTSTTHNVTGLPTNGSTVYARLFYRDTAVSNVWSSIDTTYTAHTDANVSLPSISSPTNGSTLTGPTQTFSWSANGTSVTEWWLYVGSSVAASNYHDSASLGTSTTHNVTGLPTNGSTVYVRLWYLEGGVWKSVDTTYIAHTDVNVTLPGITSPINGSTLTGATQNFSWSANGTTNVTNVTNVTEWWLYAGSSVGANDYHDSGSLGTLTTHNVTGLPTNGSMVYVRLFYKEGGVWKFVDTVYTAHTAINSALPSISSPTNGSILSGSTQTFEWYKNQTDVDGWKLEIGSSVGGSDIYASGHLSSYVYAWTAYGLPTDGSTLYVRLSYYNDNDYIWTHVDYTYTAASSAQEFTPLSPSGIINTNQPTFTWTAKSTVTGNDSYTVKAHDSNGYYIVWNSVTAAQAGCSSGTGTCSYTHPTAVFAAGYGGSWQVNDDQYNYTDTVVFIVED